MSGTRGFRYGAQPLLLTRRWQCEGLQRELADLNADVRSHAKELAALRTRFSALCEEWSNLMHAAHGPDTLLRYHELLQQLRARMDCRRGQLDALEQQRLALIDRLLAARRALDVVERHRSQMENAFIRERMSQEYKEADDMWIVHAPSPLAS